jgi:hypothetical protein
MTKAICFAIIGYLLLAMFAGYYVLKVISLTVWVSIQWGVERWTR